MIYASYSPLAERSPEKKLELSEESAEFERPEMNRLPSDDAIIALKLSTPLPATGETETYLPSEENLTMPASDFPLEVKSSPE